MLLDEVQLLDCFKTVLNGYLRKDNMDVFKKIVVTKDIVPKHYDENGILTVNIYEFLFNPGSIEG